MSKWSTAARIPTTLALPVLAGLIGAPAFAADPNPLPDAPISGAPRVAESTEAAPTVTPVTTTTTTTTTAAPTPPAAAPKKTYGGSATLETSVGLGTFVSAPQRNSLVVSTLSGSGFYSLADNLKLTAGLSLTWYQVLDVDTPLADNTVLLSDISVGLSHGRIFHDDKSGFNLGGSVRIGLPTSLASQFQNRLFSLNTGLNASLPVGPVTFSYALGFGKYFNRTATSTVNCDNFDDPSECIQGRNANSTLGYESERRGPEVYLRGAGATSFYFSNSLDISWAIVEGLDLSLGVAISNSYGVRAYAQDELSSEHAVEGRARGNRLTSSLSVSYQFIKQLSAALAFVTDTAQPFGATGNDFPVLFDLSRAPDNISSLSLSVTGSF